MLNGTAASEMAQSCERSQAVSSTPASETAISPTISPSTPRHAKSFMAATATGRG